MKPYPAKNLTIALYGKEKVYFEIQDTTTDENGNSETHTTVHKGHKEIIKMVLPISNWIDGQPPVGMYSYPFQFQIPDWLPASMIFCPGHE